MGSDLRASAALAIAGLSANGKTIVRGLEYLERGYEDFSKKLQEIGAKIFKKINIMLKSNFLITSNQKLLEKDTNQN